jgi:hypothetical protein
MESASVYLGRRRDCLCYVIQCGLRQHYGSYVIARSSPSLDSEVIRIDPENLNSRGCSPDDRPFRGIHLLRQIAALGAIGAAPSAISAAIAAAPGDQWCYRPDRYSALLCDSPAFGSL